MRPQLPLPLYLDAHNARARGIGPPFKPRRRAISKTVEAAVIQRDFEACRFCGFRSKKYQMTVATRPTLWDLDAIVTACIFCHQCFHLEQVESLRSGVLLWLPEMSQPRLHQLAREIYIGVIGKGAVVESAKRVLVSLMERGDQAEAHLSSREPKVLAERMQSLADPQAVTALREELENIRLFPLDRRIIREADLEFNQFPQIKAYWRSKDGPLNSQASFASLKQVAEHGFRALSD